MKLVLDEHIWPGVAKLAKQMVPAAEVESIHSFCGGRLMNSEDAVILREAHQAGRVLVTYDVNTIPALLQEMAAVNDEHSGVIFISAKSFAQNDHRGLASALARVIQTEGGAPWTNRVIFLTRAEDRDGRWSGVGRQVSASKRRRVSGGSRDGRRGLRRPEVGNRKPET